MDLRDLLLFGKLVDNYEADATGATARWPDAQNFKCEVPIGRRWFVWGGIINRSDSDACSVRIYNAADKIIHGVDSQAAGTGVTTWPSNGAGTAITNVPPPYILDEGWYVNIYFAGAQGATAYASCIVTEVMYEP